MNIVRRICMVLTALALVAVLTGVACAKNEIATVQDSADVLKAIMRIPEKGIPPALLRNAKAVAVIPGVIKGAFIVGGRHGTGIISMHNEDGTWSDPIFISITGGSVGWQVGGTSTDLVLVFKEVKDVNRLLEGKFTLGADAAVAAGPVGRKASAATDVTLQTGILSYSRSRGLFAGLSLEGAALLVDDDADAKFYGEKVAAKDILAGHPGKNPAVVKRLQQELSVVSQEK